MPAQVSLTVSSLADAGPGTLRAAILAADAGSPSDKFTIGFAVTGSIDLQSPLPYLTNSIAIQGPGASSLTVEPAAGVSLGMPIITVGAVTPVTSLSGLTIANGNAGGISGGLGTLTVASCAIVNNSSPYSGGGIVAAGGLSISGSIISGNSVGYGDYIGEGRGGGICILGGPLTITGSTISDNSADAGGGIYSAILSNAFAATVSDSTLCGNVARLNGGGIFQQVGPLTVSRCTLAGNTATGEVLFGVYPGAGGGIYNVGALTVSGCTLAGNTASGLDFNGQHYASRGGGIYNAGTATVRDSLFVATDSGAPNSADLGGGIYNDATYGTSIFGTLTVQGCIFTGNAASDSGGGIYNLGTATLQQCTLSANTAGSAGGGLFNGASRTLAVKDSTVLHNLAPLGADLYNLGALTLNDSTVGVIGP